MKMELINIIIAYLLVEIAVEDISEIVYHAVAIEDSVWMLYQLLFALL